MIRLFINGIAASAGGGLTYLRNVIPHLTRRPDVATTVLLNPAFRAEFEALPNLSFAELDGGFGRSSIGNGNAFRRFVQEQRKLPVLIRKSGAQVLISAGNFALWNSPVPQILLSRNSLYTSADFIRDLRRRKDYAMWADTRLKGWLAKQSIAQADITVAPSEAFAEELRKWSGKGVLALHHGFDLAAFTGDTVPLPSPMQEKLEQAGDSLRLLFVSHYNYYRNFETLFRAMPILSRQLGNKVKLFLTCQLQSQKNPGTYRAESAASVVNGARVSENIIELGSVPYGSLHHLYRACNIYVTPAYAESFAHPLIEAMSSGLPVVASDLPVHREICDDAGIYFPAFSAETLAERLLEIRESPELGEKLKNNGLRRAHDFSWSKHTESLVGLAEKLLQTKGAQY